MCVHALLWLQDLPLAMALSPLLPWLLENYTYNAQSICEHPTAQYVGCDLCFLPPPQTF